MQVINLNKINQTKKCLNKHFIIETEIKTSVRTEYYGKEKETGLVICISVYEGHFLSS